MNNCPQSGNRSSKNGEKSKVSSGTKPGGSCADRGIGETTLLRWFHNRAGGGVLRANVALRGSEVVVAQLEEVFHPSQVAGLEAGAERFDALGRRAMRVLLGRRESGGVFLQTVVSDRVGGLDGRVDVSIFDELELLLAVVRPDAGEIVSLQLQAHGPLIRFRLGGC